MNAPVRWVVLQPITHCGRPYAKGETLEVDAATAFQLVAAGVICAEREAPAPAKPVKPVAPAAAPKGREV